MFELANKMIDKPGLTLVYICHHKDSVVHVQNSVLSTVSSVTDQLPQGAEDNHIHLTDDDIVFAPKFGRAAQG